MQIALVVVLTVALAGACASRTGSTAGTADTPGAEAAAALTPQDYDGFMKDIGTAYPNLRMHLTESRQKEAADEAQQLATLFGEVERFWTQHEQPEAVKLAQTARTNASQAAGSAAAGNLDQATRAATDMQGACKQCHGMFREMDPAGGFRIRPDAIAGR